MANKVVVTPFFEKKFKRLVRKFPSLKLELQEFQSILIANPKTGIDLGSNIYKSRLASKSKNTGKSGGFRVVTFLIEETDKGFNINLITIYDKSEEDTITKEEIQTLINKIFNI